MTAAVTFNDLRTGLYLYMEGILVKYAKLTVTGSSDSYASFTVTLPLSKNPRLIRRIRPKTTGYICFGRRLFVLLEGELMRKHYVKSADGTRACEITFSGVAGNLALMKYALASSYDPSQALPSNVANFAGPADFYQISGYSVGVSEDAAVANLPAGNTTQFLASSINNKLIAQKFSKGLNAAASGSGSLDMAEAFREMMKAFIYGAAEPDGFDKTGIKVAGSLASSYLGLVNGRFRLIDSFHGFTSQELIQKFYGSAVTGDDINPFLNSVLGEGASGEFNLLQTMRLLADRAFHSITEMVAPPVLNNAKGTETVVGRMLMAPRLFIADPPVCNLFFPQITTTINYDVTPLKTTRLITAQNLPTNNGVPGTFLSVSPTSLQKQMMDGERHVNFVNAMTAEESDVGVLAQTQSNIYGSAISLTDFKQLGEWFDKTNPLRFYVARNEAQPAHIAMEFNPFVAEGFPGMLYDPDVGIVRGLVSHVTHAATPTGPQTFVTMSHCFVDDEACETLVDEINFETGMGGKFDLYKNGGPSDVYETLLGCKSLYTEMLRSSTGATAKKTLAELMVQKYEEFAASQSPQIEKEAVFSFISRSIATINDVQSFYGTVVVDAKGPTPQPIPAKLEMDFPFASPEIDTKITVLGKDGAKTQVDYVVPAGTTPGPFQVLERLTPVVDYVNDIGG